MGLSPLVQENLLVSARWGKLLAVRGFIFCALMVAGALAFMMGGSYYMGKSSFNSFGLVVGIYLVIAIILFLPCLYLYRFSVKIVTAVKISGHEDLEVASANLKALFRYLGIIAIVIISFYVLAILFAIIVLSIK